MADKKFTPKMGPGFLVYDTTTRQVCPARIVDMNLKSKSELGGEHDRIVLVVTRPDGLEVVHSVNYQGLDVGRVQRAWDAPVVETVYGELHLGREPGASPLDRRSYSVTVTLTDGVPTDVEFRPVPRKE